MKRTKFTDAKMVLALRQVEEGTSISEIFRKAGIAEATFCNWRKSMAD